MIDNTFLNLEYQFGRPAERRMRQSFKPEDGRVSRRVIANAKGRDIIRIENVSEATADEFENYTKRIYDTLIAAPVWSTAASCGLLVVDSDKAHSLTKSDAEYVALVAGVLGSGFAHHESVTTLGVGGSTTPPSGGSIPLPRETATDSAASHLEGEDD